MRAEMIVTDLDNTLLKRDKSISDYTVGVLNRLKRRGILIAFATARAERVTRRFQARIAPDIVIADNGAIISMGDAVLRRLPISGETVNRLIRTLKSLEAVSCLTAETGHCLYTDYDGPPWDKDDWEAWNTVYTDFSVPIHEEVTKISIECGDVELLRGIIRDFPELHLYCNNGEVWSQVMRKEATKMDAVAFVARERGINLSDIVAFGDDVNDVEMLSGCGIGVAVENASVAAKAAAKDICLSNEWDGVATWIERSLL